jgi:hypothetical protein
MAEMVAVESRRVVTPVIAALLVVSLLAAVLLGFALRAWTDDDTSPPARPTVVVQREHPTPPMFCRAALTC